MTSSDVDIEVKRLRRTGETIRAIAERLGLSKSRVGRIAAELEDDDDDELEDDELEDDDELDAYEVARLNAMDSGQPVTPPITYVGVETTVSTAKGWDTLVCRELRYLDAEGHSLSILDVYRYTQELEQSGRWAEAEELTAELDRQHAADPELTWVTDMLGTNGHYEPRESDAVDSRWTWVGPSS